jgi:hypothetical protein
MRGGACVDYLKRCVGQQAIEVIDVIEGRDNMWAVVEI